MRTVLVFPSSNEPGMEVLRALAPSRRFSLVSASGVPASVDPSAGLVARHRSLPFFGQSGFDAAFDRLLAEEGVDQVFLTTDALVRWGAERREAGDTRFVAPSVRAATLCASKRATQAELRGVVPLPDPWSSLDDGPGFARPDEGGGSRGTFVVDSPATAALARERSLLVDRWLPGAEFTVDCLGGLDGGLLAAVPRERTAIGRGIALGARVVDRPDLVEYVRALQAHVRIAGPFFAQFREDDGGKPRLLEVNARVGGSMGTTRLAGVNLPQLAAHVFAHEPVRVPSARVGFHIRRSLRLQGSLEGVELVVWDLDDTLVRPDGRPDPALMGWMFELANRGVEQRLLTRNADPERVLERLHIPRLFSGVFAVDDKLPVIAGWLEAGRMTVEGTVLVNDSNQEKLAMLDRWPDLRILTPDAIDAIAPAPLSAARPE